MEGGTQASLLSTTLEIVDLASTGEVLDLNPTVEDIAEPFYTAPVPTEEGQAEAAAAKRTLTAGQAYSDTMGKLQVRRGGGSLVAWAARVCEAACRTWHGGGADGPARWLHALRRGRRRQIRRRPRLGETRRRKQNCGLDAL
jgi:hypothetical protein